MISRQVRVITQNDQIKEFPSENALCLLGGHQTDLTGMVDRSSLTAPTASFLKTYKSHSTHSLMGCWFLTICITF
jgi:hypothetical protein